MSRIAARRVLLGCLAAACSINSCAPPEPAPAAQPVAASATPDPQLRIGILVNTPRVRVESDGAIRVADPDTGPLQTSAPGALFDVTSSRRNVLVRDGADSVSRPELLLEPADTNDPLRVNGHAYRGVIELRQGDSGLVVINRVSLERYLVGVVGAEMGKRAPEEAAAVRAQAVASRTYAIRNQGRNQAQGFDLVATVNDQLYPGDADENPLAAAAVADTRGEVLTYQGQPIDAFFFAACGGRTEDGTAAFAGADRPYLRSVDDRDPSGTPWCADAPHLHWSTGWTSDALAAVLRRTLAAEGLAGGSGTLRDVRVVHRTGTDRVGTIAINWRNGSVAVSGQAIRRVLAPPEGGWLRSTDFTIRVARTGGRIERVDVDGTGNGHGVGMCQWGAIGRARAGEDYRTILMNYFPGTDIRRLY